MLDLHQCDVGTNCLRIHKPGCCCSDEEGSELADLQRVLQRVVSSKKASARQKQAAIVQVGTIPNSVQDPTTQRSDMACTCDPQSRLYCLSS